MSKKKPIFSFEEDMKHHKEFIRHFEIRIEPLLTKAKGSFSLQEQFDTFENMYSWMIKHLQKFEDSAYQLTTELLSNFVEKDREHASDDSVKGEIVQLLYLQTFIKVHSFFETPGKHDYFQSILMYMLAKKLIKFSIESPEELFFGLLVLMIAQDMLRKTAFFFPEVVICFERVIAFFVKEIKEKSIKFDKKNLNPNDKDLHNKEIFTLHKQIYEGKIKLEDTSFYLLSFKIIDKLLNTFSILLGSDTNCDIVLANLINILDKIENPTLLSYSESTIKKIKNIVEQSKHKIDMFIIKDKPLIRIKQLTPKIEDSDAELQGDYDEELKKQKRTLKKAVDKETKKAKKELAYDALVLQTQKDKDKETMQDRKKNSFKHFVKFMEDQKLEEKRIKTTQLQHKPRNKTKKRRLAGNKTDPGKQA